MHPRSEHLTALGKRKPLLRLPHDSGFSTASRPSPVALAVLSVKLASKAADHDGDLRLGPVMPQDPPKNLGN